MTVHEIVPEHIVAGGERLLVDASGLLRRLCRLHSLRRLLLRRFAVRQEQHARGDRRQQGEQDEPEGGFPVIQHVFHTLLYTDLPERQRAGEHQPPVGAAVEQREGVSLAPGEIELADDPFVAGELNVPAEQDISQPHQWVEPVDREQQPAQRLPPVVAPREVRPLVGEHGRALRLRQSGGQVNFRRENAEDEGRVRRVADINAGLDRRGNAHFPPQAQPAYSCVKQQKRHPSEPDAAQRRHEGAAHRLRCGNAVRRRHNIVRAAVRRRGRPSGADRRVIARRAGINDAAIRRIALRPALHELAAADRLRHGGDGAFRHRRQQQPQRHRRPEQTARPFRCPAQRRAQHEHRYDQQRRRHRAAQQLQKYRFHRVTPPRSSAAARPARAR